MKKAKPEVTLLLSIDPGSGKPVLTKNATERCIVNTLIAGGINPGRYEISLLLTGDTDMRELNCQYRGLNRTTDVLSFPQFEPGEILSPTPAGVIALGDIVISLDTLRRRCIARAEKPEIEFCRLVAHGVLHLIGYDHQDRRGRDAMRSAEDTAIDMLSC